MPSEIISGRFLPVSRRGSGPGWWSRSGSNRRPRRCERRALSTELLPRGEGKLSEILGRQVHTNLGAARLGQPRVVALAAHPRKYHLSGPGRKQADDLNADMLPDVGAAA